MEFNFIYLIFFFFFNDTATTEIYTLSLHDALPISVMANGFGDRLMASEVAAPARLPIASPARTSATVEPSRPATATTSPIETSAPRIAASGSAKDSAPASPK